VPLSGLLTLLGGFHFVIQGDWQITGLRHCCCQARNLSMGPLYSLLMLLRRSRVCHGVPVRPSHLLLSPSPHSAMCHFQVSSHCWWVFPFCHRVLYGGGAPLLLPPPRNMTCGYCTHSGFGCP
ncbi:unnamed protein product, partial [Staurois parvus]